MKKIFIFFIIVSIGILNVNAENRYDFLTNTDTYINNNKTNKLTDNNYNTYSTIPQNQELKISNENNFNSIYVIYYLNSTTGNIEYNNKTIEIGKNNFLHEYIKLEENTNNITIKYDNDVIIKEIFLFNKEVPSWVQIWNPPHEDADILLFSTHSDDEQLFFAGLIPSMVAQGKKMQVVYFANHNNTPSRLDEQLNGLWAAGLKNYPVLGLIPDAYSETLNEAISNLKSSGLTIDDTIKFQVNMIRRFKPEVIVGHDENGEYGHGQHRLNTHSLKEALKVVNNEQYETEYKPFEPFKVYLHLYKDNQIKMDYDTPLDYFDGKTAFQMSQLGYKEHLSQQYTWFTRWINGNNNSITKASQITTYNPTEFGLYYSKVGYDNKDNDMFYNVPYPKNAEIEVNILEEKQEENKKTIINKSPNIYTILFAIIILITISLIILKIVLSKRMRRKRRRRKRRRKF